MNTINKQMLAAGLILTIAAGGLLADREELSHQLTGFSPSSLSPDVTFEEIVRPERGDETVVIGLSTFGLLAGLLLVLGSCFNVSRRAGQSFA